MFATRNLMATWLVTLGMVSSAAAQDAGTVQVANETGRIVKVLSRGWTDASGKDTERTIGWMVGPNETMTLKVDGRDLAAREFRYTLRTGSAQKDGTATYEAGKFLRVALTSDSLPVVALPAAPVAVLLHPAKPQAAALTQRELQIRQIIRYLPGDSEQFYVIGLSSTRAIQTGGGSDTAGSIFGLIFAPLTFGASLNMVGKSTPPSYSYQTNTGVVLVQGREAAAEHILRHYESIGRQVNIMPTWQLFGRYKNGDDAETARKFYTRQHDPMAVIMEGQVDKVGGLKRR